MNSNDKTHIREVIFVSKLALVLLLVFVVARTALLQGRLGRDLAPDSAQDINEVPVSQQVDSPVLSLEDYAEIVKRNMFGSSERSAGEWSSVKNYTNPEYSVSTELGLALFGTISGNPSVARAIIKNLKNGVLDMYEIGQMVGGARIEVIGEDSVVFMHNGERKTLGFNAAGPVSYAGGTARMPSYQSVDNSSRTVKTVSARRGSNVGAQAMLGYVRTILQSGTVEPYITNNRVEGLKITGVNSIEGTENLGLRDGDILCAVNGHTLTSKQKAFQVFSKAKTQGEINLELLRGNEPKQLSFSLW